MAEKPPPYGPQGPEAYPQQQPGNPYQSPPAQGAPYQPQPQPQPGVTVVTVGNVPVAEKWGWGNLVLAGISFFCCTCLGLAALIAAILAYVDHKVKDFTRSQKKKRIAMYTAIASIVVGSIVFLIIVLSGGIAA